MADAVMISISQEARGKGILGQMNMVQTSAFDQDEGPMTARQGHSATLIDGSRVLVIGGRSSPAE